jgi:dienelactone hydrolase
MRCALSLLILLLPLTAPAEPLPGTAALTAEGDLAAAMVAGIDRYLMREIAASVEKRQQYWKPDYSSHEAYTKSLQPNRERLKKILGIVDQRVPVEMHFVATTEQPALVAETDAYKVFAVRWPVLEGVDGEGLLLEPKGKVVANVVAIPDADQTPEMLVGLAPGFPKERQFARRLAENNHRVVIPVLINRENSWAGNPRIRMTNQPHREFIYRMAYEMGRHIIAFEVQKLLAVVDWFTNKSARLPIKVIGYGEGGLVAYYGSAIETRIKAAGIYGYFGPRETLWKEPIYRNVWGLLREFGDAELSLLAVSNGGGLIIETNPSPTIPGPPSATPARSGAAPGGIRSLDPAEVTREVLRLDDSKRPRFGGSRYNLGGLKEFLTLNDFIAQSVVDKMKVLDQDPPGDARKSFDSAPRQKRQFDQLVAYTQKLMRDSEVRRQEFFWSKIDTSSVANYEKSTVPLRKYFWEEVIGKLPAPDQPMRPKSRVAYDTPKWTGYEVTLDLYPDVFAYGILCVPKDLKEGEKRPVIVCQHGLEGRPQDVVNPKEKTRAYNSYGAQLADLGYIVYAPQNPYIGKDDFRVLQRKANPLGLSLFSFIVSQHERTLDWLETLPFVAKDKIAFYGLSYGGKTAMRVPAILPRYCLSICSGDFNEWIVKNVSVDFKGSYMFTGEYEMFEFDLGNTFNYAEMAALIAPRPFMVERGHDDGVGIDEMVAYEYAKVRRLYSRLKIPDRTEIEFFPGGHVINGQGTFAFLRKHLGR